MTQTATVSRTLQNGMAEICVVREGACSHNCSDCQGCMTAKQPTVYAQAKNPAGAKAGDIVVVESKNGPLLGIAVVVYLIPMLLLLAGYFIGYALGFSQNGCILVAFLFFVVSFGLSVLLNRYVKQNRAVTMTITKVVV
ncbi:MAG: SoxR reducing system RseC family protein [Intestinimonas sp.]|jgi:sigma-E factor negative regulatory protein RseC|nr:SoxR reducing system RseC family protein [Intestinimonas sp.]